MTYDFQKFLQDYAIDYKPGKRGYTDINCPFCEDTTMHGGLHKEGYYTCWRCGGHSVDNTIYALIREQWRLLQDRYQIFEDKEEEYIAPAEQIYLPMGVHRLDNRQMLYLKDRGFDPNYLEHEYGLVGTGKIGPFKHRIIIPIRYGYKLVSYLGRDYTGQSPLRYKACERKDEVIHHKHIFYNMDNMNIEHGVVVEGCVDTWRMGRGSIATFGTGWTKQQRNLLVAKKVKRLTFLYDAEEEARKRAESFANEMAGCTGIDVDMILLKEGDPGDLPQNDADQLMKEIMEK